jgi:threonine dehydratase
MADYPYPPIDFDDVRAAQARIEPYVYYTPVFTSKTLDEQFGASFYFKSENLQKTGSFKFWGACNAIFSLSKGTAERGVVTHSSGNFAQALALAAKARDIPAHIVMPENVSPTKHEAVVAYGGDITFCVPTNAARQETAEKLLRRRGRISCIPPTI